jgi:hypothetical protein
MSLSNLAHVAVSRFFSMSVPLHGVAHHVEGGKEHLAGLLSALDVKELFTAV